MFYEVAPDRRSRAAEDFIAGDPFVRNGVVSTYTLEEWNEVLA